MNQSDVVKRIESICQEFDSRVNEVGLAIARLELAKALAECEAAQQSVQPDDYNAVPTIIKSFPMRDAYPVGHKNRRR